MNAIDSEVHGAHTGTLILRYANLARFQRARLVPVALAANCLQQTGQMGTSLGGRSGRTTLGAHRRQTDNLQCARLASQHFSLLRRPSLLYTRQ